MTLPVQGDAIGDTAPDELLGLSAATSPLLPAGVAAVGLAVDGADADGSHVPLGGASPECPSSLSSRGGGGSSSRVPWRPKAAEGLRLSRECLDDGSRLACDLAAAKPGGSVDADSTGAAGGGVLSLSAHPYHGLGSNGLGSSSLLLGGGVSGIGMSSSAHAAPPSAPPSGLMPLGSAVSADGDMSSFMTGWVDVDGFSSPAALGVVALPGQPKQQCRAEAAGPSPAVLEDVGCSPTLLGPSPHCSSRMSARTTSC